MIMQPRHQAEVFPLVDEDGNLTGTALRSECHNGVSMLLHPVVHLHLFNEKGQLYLQKRALTKDTQPGKWDTSVGGHFGQGEAAEDALRREASEEIGIGRFAPHFLGKYIWQSDVERELVFTFYTVADDEPAVDHVEVDEGRFWSHDEIEKNLSTGIFTPNFEYEFRNYLKQCFLSPPEYKAG